MKANFKRLVFTSLLCVGIVACSSDDDDDGNNGSTVGDEDPSADINSGDAGSTSSPAPGTTAGEIVDAFDGTWVSNCAQAIQLPTVTEFQRATLVVSGDTYVGTFDAFTDSDCSVAATPAQVVIDFSMQFPEGEVETPFGTASFVDQEPESITVDGFDASILQDFAGLGTQYTIFVVGNDGQLYTGLPADSADQRPATLNTDVFFVLQ